MRVNVMPVTSYQEIQEARGYIARHGYEVSVHENGHLIVKDPVHSCGHGAQAGRLVLTGFQNVAVRSYSDALKFIRVREPS